MSSLSRPGTAGPIAVLCAGFLALTACGGDSPADVAAADDPTASPTEGDVDARPGNEAAPTATPEADGQGEAGSPVLGVTADLGWGTEPRVGTWRVGNAGEVEVDLRDGRLVLVDVRTAPEWTSVVDEESADEIEVDFRRGPAEWEIEIEYEDGELEVEIDFDLDPAEPGRYAVGEAGTVEIALTDGALRLVDFTENEGWTARVTSEDPDEIEVDFFRGPADYEFEAELDDGVLEVEIDFEAEGRFPR